MSSNGKGFPAFFSSSKALPQIKSNKRLPALSFSYQPRHRHRYRTQKEASALTTALALPTHILSTVDEKGEPDSFDSQLLLFPTLFSLFLLQGFRSFLQVFEYVSLVGRAHSQ
jgi:hypothetical protein